MKIDRVAVTYGELRSTGFPSFSNKRYEITLEATLTPRETAREVRERLTELAKREVKQEFGDNVDQMELPLDMPF